MADEVLMRPDANVWLRLRPETMLGEMAVRAQLEHLVGFAPELATLSFEQPITTLEGAELARLRRQQLRTTRATMTATAPADDEEDADRDGKVEVVEKSEPVPKQEVGAALMLMEYSPALMKIVDEILQNASDRPGKDPLMKSIRVGINAAEGIISVRNDGSGMQVTIAPAKTEGETPKYWPTVLFTELMTGGNFVTAEGEEHHQGGRNGIGAKATNICSQWFRVTIGDPINHKWFQQEWRDGATVTLPPVIKAFKPKLGFVEIEFKPDLAFFGHDPALGFTPALTALFASRAWEIAATTPDRISVWLNDVRLPVKNLAQYTAAFESATVRPARSSLINARGVAVWDVSLLPASHTLPAGVVGFVNGVKCSSGTHVAYLFSRLARHLQDVVRRKAKLPDLTLSSAAVQAAVFVVLSVRIHEPRFTSQTKDHLSSLPSEWGKQLRWEPDEAFVRRVTSLVADPIAASIKLKTDATAMSKAQKSAGGGGVRSVNIAKYETATTAGKPGTAAMLLLTEGDSARNLAMAGRAVTGPDLVGVFCLKGKPMNTRANPLCKVLANEVLNQVAAILGLKYDKPFETEADIRRLRYAHLVVMADQDVDGAHIVGLVVNWIEDKWPGLLRLRPDFVRRFATPIVIAQRRRSAAARLHPEPSVQFLSLPVFKEWLRADPSRKAAYDFEYYKGLGGHTDALGRQYFAEAAAHMVTLRYSGDSDHEALCDFFLTSRSDARKDMLRRYDETRYVDYSLTSVSIAEFLEKEMLHYGRAHTKRAVPGIDGLKEAQRKLVFAARRIGPAPGNAIKLTDLAARCQAESQYHQGETSLWGTLVCMAQSHVGSNNVNLFMNTGQMGSRLTKREEFTAPRYLRTGLDKVINTLFRKEDDPILRYRIEDGKYMVEPEQFAPVVPMDLLNGCSGVGTGWSTEIPAFHPSEIVTAFRKCIMGDADWVAFADAMLPWYDGFTGAVEATDRAWQTYGLYHVEEADKTTNVVLSDLPVGTWTGEYDTEVLMKLLIGTPGGFIRHKLSQSTNTRVRYVLECDTEAFHAAVGTERAPAFEPDGRGFPNSADDTVLRQAADVYAMGQRRWPKLEKLFKLECSNSWTLMHRFNAAGQIVHYPHTSDIIAAYVAYRLPLYAERIAAQIAALRREVVMLHNKQRFVQEVNTKAMDPMAYNGTAEWWADLLARGFISETDPAIAPPPPKIVSDLPELADAAAAVDMAPEQASYRYLTSMQISSFTRGLLAEVANELARVEKAIEDLTHADPAAKWLAELEEFNIAYQEFMDRRREANHIVFAGDNKTTNTKKKPKQPPTKRQKVGAQ